MSVIKLEVPADNERALSAAAAFFAQLSGTAIALGEVSQVVTVPNMCADAAAKARVLVGGTDIPLGKVSQVVAPPNRAGAGINVSGVIKYAEQGDSDDDTAEPLESIVRKIDAATDQGNAEQDDSDDDTAEPSAPTIVNGVEVDSAGLPWDRRIHSSAKSKIKDGTWKKLRGVDDALVAQVEAELRQSMNPVAPVAEPVQAAAPMPPAPAREVAAAPVAESVPAAAPTPPAPAATNAAPVTFADAMKKYAAAKAKNVISDAQAAEFCQGKGLNGIASLSVCPGEIRGEFVAMVEALAAAAGVTL